MTEDTARAVSEFLDGMSTQEMLRMVELREGLEERPVSINTFIDDPDYLGQYFDGVEFNPYWRKVLNRIYPTPLSSPYWLVALRGSIGRGKCLWEHSLLSTDKGILSIRNIKERWDQGESIQVLSEQGPRPITDAIYSGELPQYKVRLGNGTMLRVSERHRFRVVDGEYEEMGWKRAKDLSPGDLIVSTRQEHPSSDSRLPSCVAYMLGLIVGDGSIEENNVRISVGSNKRNSPDMIGDLEKGLSAIGMNLRIKEYQNYYGNTDYYMDARGPFAGVRSLLQGVQTSDGRGVPNAVLESGRGDHLDFLAGLIDTDGHVSKDVRGVEIITKSDVLMRQLVAMLTGLGIRVSCKNKFVKDITVNGSDGKPRKYEVNKSYHRVWIRHDGIARLHRMGLRLRVNHKKELFERYANSFTGRDFNVRTLLPGSSALISRVFNRLKASNRKPSSRRTAGLFVAQGGKQHASLETVKRIDEEFPGAFDQESAARYLLDKDCYLNPVESVEVGEPVPMYDISVWGSPTYVVDGVVSHNTTTACIGMLYDMHRLLCHINPQGQAGLVSSTVLVFAVFNVTMRLSSDVMGQLEEMMASSPWFQAQIDPDRQKSGHNFFLRKKIDFRVGSRITHTQGRAVYEAILDEAEFEVVSDQVYKNFNSLLRRIQSRFGAGFPGRIWVISSEGEKFSVINKIVESYRGDSGIYVDSSTLWEVVPQRMPVFHETGETFPVFKGTTDRKPYVVTASDDPILNTHPDCVLQVPIDLKRTFDADIYSSLRDLAGEPIVSKYRLFNQPDRLNAALIIKPVFPPTFQIDFYDDHDLIQNHARLPGYFRNRMSENYPRHIHIDIGLTGDRLGFACGFIAGFKERSFLDPASLEEVSQTVPDTVTEFGFAIEAKPGQQIPLHKVRAFIQYLASMGFVISHVSCDGFQSADTLQQMKRMGYDTSVTSVDRTSEPYVRFRNSVHEGLWSGPRDHLLRTELANLELTPDGKKVDHPADRMDRVARPEGEEGDEEWTHPSKDYADACAGMHTTLNDRAPDYVMLYVDTSPRHAAVNEKTFEYFWGKAAKSRQVGGV